MKKNIIVCGYPKSGNTWLTRLTAEIAGCPAIGFWCQPFNNEESIEGLDRDSGFQCFKSHHTYEQMSHTLNIYGNGNEKIIYIYRDPRSVVVSAAHYFRLRPKHPRLLKLMEKLPKGNSFYHKFLQSQSYKLEIVSRGLIEGTDQGHWLKEPWKSHIMGYQNKDKILALSYEYLREDTLAASGQISEFLSIRRTESELMEAIRAQGFAAKKKKFLEEGKNEKSNFMRKGKTDSWQDELPAKYVDYIEQEIGDFMQHLGYRLSSNL